MTSINLSRLHFPVTTLGPGKRIGVWFQGCSIRCSGCVSLDTWAHDRGSATVASLLETMEPHLPEAQGLTVSGGEPFDQAEALLSLLQAWRVCHTGDVLVYSGYSIEALADRLPHFAGLIDALITDPFDSNAPQTLLLRGSDNQRLHTLSPLGKSRFSSLDRPLLPEDRQLDVMFDDVTRTVFFAGVPSRGDMIKLAKILRSSGHQAAVSEDKAAS